MLEVSISPRIALEFKNCTTEDWLEWNIKGIQAELAGCAKYPEEAVALKAVDEQTGEIAGYAVWGWSARAANLIIQDKADIALPARTNTSLRQTFISRLTKVEEQFRPQGKHYELCQMTVSLRYQRRGIGSQLVKYGLDKADRDTVTCFLTGSPMGVPVYQKLGFEEVGSLEMDLKDFGGEGTHVHGECCTDRAWWSSSAAANDA
ncbi:Acetyltransferase [Hyphodiscus hymeniophilus]|uniref:Acetyltransferase n=1 Tax=Hyphodiscus hymeniophilus TaxID=353542 RepID=A0A9P7B0T9_9HELO|nr:Acetyltransferase [Hyphodiscus hymeniophilus]